MPARKAVSAELLRKTRGTSLRNKIFDSRIALIPERIADDLFDPAVMNINMIRMEESVSYSEKWWKRMKKIRLFQHGHSNTGRTGVTCADIQAMEKRASRMPAS